MRRVSAEREAGKSYELWLVSDRFSGPRSLGVIGDTDFTRAALAAYDQDTISSATYAVSVEPQGGSTTGAPTGPVVYAGKLVEAIPPATPAKRLKRLASMTPKLQKKRPFRGVVVWGSLWSLSGLRGLLGG